MLGGYVITDCISLCYFILGLDYYPRRDEYTIPSTRMEYGSKKILTINFKGNLLLALFNVTAILNFD